MTTGQLSIDFHPANLSADEAIVIDESPPNSTDSTLKVFSKTPEDFLKNDNYTAPKYATWTSVTSETGETISAGTMSCDAKKTVYSSESPLILQINGERILSSQNEPLVGKSYKSFSEDFNTDKSVIINLKQDDLINLEGDYTGYLTLAGPALWSCQVGLSWHSFYLKHPTIVLNYICPKFTINLETNDSAMGTVTFAEGSSSVVDITKKGQNDKKATIIATPNDGYFFIKWEDDNDGKEGPSRTIELKEADLTSSNTILTYKAIFGKKELYVGSKRLDAIYVGTKKAKVYRGSTRIL